jgi:hypothetical protein
VLGHGADQNKAPSKEASNLQGGMASCFTYNDGPTEGAESERRQSLIVRFQL